MIRLSIAAPLSIKRLYFRRVTMTVLTGEGIADAMISLAFVDDRTIQRINRQFLGHDEPTDVISFPLSPPTAIPLEGELVIGEEIAKRQSQARGHAVKIELALYVIHGLLHLCGYDDKTAATARKMRRRERHYLRQLGLPDIVD